MLTRKKRFDIVCVGSASQDIFFPVDEGTVIRTPEDVTSREKIAFELGGKVLSDDRYESVGGVAANTAQGFSLLGLRAACYSKIGSDPLGRWIKSELRRQGVGCGLLQTEPGLKTDLSAIIVLRSSGERVIFHNRDANERLEMRPSGLRDTAWVLVSALNGHWKENLSQLLKAKKRYGFKLALNPGQHNMKEAPGCILEALREADALLLNKDEATELSLRLAPEKDEAFWNDEYALLQTLAGAGAGLIGMTDGKRGAWGYDGQEYWHCPIHTLNGVIDSTGAGDAFASGFLAAHILDEPLDNALRWGIANSGSVVGFYGGAQGLLKRARLEKMIDHIIPQRIR